MVCRYRKSSSYVWAGAWALLFCFAVLLAGCHGHVAGGVDVWDAVDMDDPTAIAVYASSGGDLDVLNGDGSTPLWVALEGDHKDSYEALLSYGANPNVVMSGKRVVTHWAAMKEDAWWLKKALERGADPNLINYGRGRPLEGGPLKAAISNGTLENVRLLVEYGADINRPDEPLCHPLATAAAQVRFDVVLYLLEQGADYERAQCAGITFLDNIRTKVENRDRWFRLEEDRKGLDAVREWLETRGVEFEDA